MKKNYYTMDKTIDKTRTPNGQNNTFAKTKKRKKIFLE